MTVPTPPWRLDGSLDGRLIEPLTVDPRTIPDELQQLADRLATPEALEDRVARSRRPRAGSRRAAVLIMLGEAEGDVTFTERAGTMRKHPGQISFPGGSLDEGERPVQAALREAWEEVGVEPSAMRVLGQLPPAHVAASAFDVAGIMALWSGTEPLRAVDPAEVAAIHRYRITDLADPVHRVTARIPSGYRGPAFSMGEILIWGFTAHLLDCVLELGGWARPWRREVELDVPWRFLREARTE